MWQRIQTLFLAIVVITMIAGIFFPVWIHVDQATSIRYELYPLHYSVIDGDARNIKYIPYCVTAVLMIAAATMAVMAIRRYDNRLTQMKIVALNTLILVFVLGSAVYFSTRLNEEYNYIGMSRLSLWTMFGGVAANWLAMRFIRRDERIVRDSDRLR